MKIAPQDIAFDFDGVVADTFRLFVHLAHAEYGIEINYEDITHYEFLKVIKMDRATADRIVEQLTDRPHELDLKPNKGATRMLTRFAEFSPILFVTARPTGGPVALWCEKTMPHLLSSIHIEATGESTAKLPVLKEHGVRYFVEDRLDTCHLLAEAGILLPDNLPGGGRVAPDDVVDAAVAAWSATRVAAGTSLTLPSSPSGDAADGGVIHY